MSKVPFRRLLSKLTALALSTSAVGPATADALRDARDAGERDISDTNDAEDCELDANRPIDAEHLDAEAAGSTLGRGLALALAEMRPLSATHIAATWALSTERLRRLAVANALERSFPLVGGATVIDHLSRDGDPAIRAASARAAWARRDVGGDLGVLARLARDPDPLVRAIAASARSA